MPWLKIIAELVGNREVWGQRKEKKELVACGCIFVCFENSHCSLIVFLLLVGCVLEIHYLEEEISTTQCE
jgi:hypothetical protein